MMMCLQMEHSLSVVGVVVVVEMSRALDLVMDCRESLSGKQTEILDLEIIQEILLVQNRLY